MKVARWVREGTVGKGPQGTSLAVYFMSEVGRANHLAKRHRRPNSKALVGPDGPEDQRGSCVEKTLVSGAPGASKGCMPGSEESSWKRACQGNALAAYPTLFVSFALTGLLVPGTKSPSFQSCTCLHLLLHSLDWQLPRCYGVNCQMKLVRSVSFSW